MPAADGDVVEEDVAVGMAARRRAGLVQQEARTGVGAALDDQQRRTDRQAFDSGDGAFATRGGGASSSLRKSARKTDVVSTVTLCRELLSLSVTRRSSLAACGDIAGEPCPAHTVAALDVTARSTSMCGDHGRNRPLAGTLTTRHSVRVARYASGVEQTGRGRRRARRPRRCRSTSQPAPYGSEFTRSGLPSRSPLTATTFAVSGAYRSDTDLVDSTSPNASPGGHLGADVGQAARRRRRRARTGRSR